ncbi:GerAB/ArcD/ProY family transporter [Paenibacillus spongiae]|uniref:Spore germination protein n=1 Tax=Paenibacillus spongiae TaxID=2909671 RepID=A0ABY5S4F7_9BACL|nr:spore germination protein [Paenibacillus spongiae]UVI28776.1 spore germination protein [Paenibacillus spongiae]
MPSQHTIRPDQQIPPSSALYVVFGTQVGLDYLTFQRKLAQAVGQDAWIAVILAGLLVHAAIFWMFSLLNRQQADLATINKRLFGSWVGACFNSLLIAYFLLVCTVSLRLYVEIVKIWIFPTIDVWVMELILLLLSYYIVSGGLRVIVGFFMFAQVFVLLNGIFYFLRFYYHSSNFLPVLSHPLPDMVKAVAFLIPGYMGVEALLLYYPYFSNGRKAQKWTHWANAATLTVYLIIVGFSLMFFSLGQLKDETWPTLTLFKFVELPFMERVEFIGATFQLSRLIPILSLYLWTAIQMTRQQFGVAKRRMLPVYMAIVFIGGLMFKDAEQTLEIYSIVGQGGFVLLFVYVPLLALMSRWIHPKGARV